MTPFYVKQGRIHAPDHFRDVPILVPEVVAGPPILADPGGAAVPGKRDSLGAPPKMRSRASWLEEVEERVFLFDFLLGHDLAFDYRQ